METDSFDFIEETPKRRRNYSGMVWNCLTMLVLLSVVCVGLVALMVFINPNIGFNPFPPPTLPVAAVLDTPTPTPRIVFPPTWTPEPTVEPTITKTPRPTSTPFQVTEQVVPLVTATQTSTTEPTVPSDGYAFEILDGDPRAISVTIFYPDRGCEWMGVAGQVFDLSGAPLTSQIVEVGGFLSGETIGNPTLVTLTGLARSYGEAGYEIQLADKPVYSSGMLWAQLVDQQNLPLSDKYYFDTFLDCDENLILINFKQVR